MPIDILMPALSPTMTEGTLARWHKKEGDAIAAGDVIAEIETDKATMEVEAVDEGTLGKILISDGSENVAVNTVIGVLLEEGENADDIKEKPAANSNDAPQPANKGYGAPATPAPAATSGASGKKSAPETDGSRVFASPLARRIAEQKGLDLTAVQGSGPGGRIVKADVEQAQPGATSVAGSGAQAKQTAVGSSASMDVDKDGLPPYRTEPHSSMRKVIARRLSESKQQVPHFYLTVDIELDALLALRKQLNSRDDGTKLSVNDFIIRACGMALHDVPEANAAWTDGGARYFERADVSVAVAIDGGLITPIIRGAGQKRLPQISKEMKDLASRARAGKLLPEEFNGGTFSLSNLGMFGIKHFQAIVNPPQACILAVGAGEQRAIVRDGQLAVATQMSATLSVDHRIVDGAIGARYLEAFKNRVQDPLGLLL